MSILSNVDFIKSTGYFNDTLKNFERESLVKDKYL